MARNHPLLSLIYFFLLLLLLSGCAAGPLASKLPPAQATQKTGAAKDYTQAVKRFEHLAKNNEMQDEYHYDYGLALSATGRYAEAIEQLASYMNSLAQRNDNYYLALAASERAEEQLRLQQQEAQRVQLAESTRNKIAPATNSNLQLVQQYLEAGTAVFNEPLTGMEMILIKGGCYQMGDQFGDGEADERPSHKVCVDDFYLGRYEVTIEQWLQVMGYNPSEFKHAGQYPVDSISWQEATTFAEVLSAKNGGYRLPTEAEWEYAARSGGKKQKFSGGDNVAEVAWHEDNAGDGPHPIGQKQPNELGLYDMSGNLYEWCFDRYVSDYYQQSPTQNPTGTSSGNARTRRGGSWSSEISYQRTSYRAEENEISYRHWNTGFRLALPVSR